MLHWKNGAAALAAAALVTIVVANLEGQSLKGSPQSVERMYTFAVNGGFDFYRNSSSVTSAANTGKLVRLTPNADYELHDVDHPFVKSEVRMFVERLGAQYRDVCKEPLVVTSAVRPSNVKLRNASDYSVHPTGISVDLRRPRAAKCLSWLQKTLLSLEKTGVIEATQERNPPHFHVAVFPAPYTSYVSRQTPVVLATAARHASGPSDASDPQVVSYHVRSGDSLWLIAVKHDTTVAALQELNKLRNSTIMAGQVLLVPVSNTPR